MEHRVEMLDLNVYRLILLSLKIFCGAFLLLLDSEETDRNQGERQMGMRCNNRDVAGTWHVQ